MWPSSYLDLKEHCVLWNLGKTLSCNTRAWVWEQGHKHVSVFWKYSKQPKLIRVEIESVGNFSLPHIPLSTHYFQFFFFNHYTISIFINYLQIQIQIQNFKTNSVIVSYLKITYLAPTQKNCNSSNKVLLIFRGARFFVHILEAVHYSNPNPIHQWEFQHPLYRNWTHNLNALHYSNTTASVCANVCGSGCCRYSRTYKTHKRFLHCHLKSLTWPSLV